MKSTNILCALVLLSGLAAAQVPTIEREALIALYNATDGANWKNNWKWRNADDTGFNAVGTECTWKSVRCTGSNVTTLDLFYNWMSGSIPPELGNLSSLEYLELRSNQLSGRIPPELGNLSNLVPVWFDIGYNALWTDDPVLRAFLDSLDKDPWRDYSWEGTQTIAPADLAIDSTTSTSVSLSWTPPFFTSKTGGYIVTVYDLSGARIFAEKTESDDPSAWSLVTTDKTTTAYTVPGKTTTNYTVVDVDLRHSYLFEVQMFTNPHPYNKNTVVSEPVSIKYRPTVRRPSRRWRPGS